MRYWIVPFVLHPNINQTRQSDKAPGNASKQSNCSF